MLSAILEMLLKLSIALLSTKNVPMEIVAWSLEYSSAYADVINGVRDFYVQRPAPWGALVLQIS
jgi:hypothetical protein